MKAQELNNKFLQAKKIAQIGDTYYTFNHVIDCNSGTLDKTIAYVDGNISSISSTYTI